jgi:hypothetical protein
VYTYDAVPDAVTQVDELPVAALSEYAELIAFLELTPWEGALPGGQAGWQHASHAIREAGSGYGRLRHPGGAAQGGRRQRDVAGVSHPSDS